MQNSLPSVCLHKAQEGTKGHLYTQTCTEPHTDRLRHTPRTTHGLPTLTYVSLMLPPSSICNQTFGHLNPCPTAELQASVYMFFPSFLLSFVHSLVLFCSTLVCVLLHFSLDETFRKRRSAPPSPPTSRTWPLGYGGGLGRRHGSCRVPWDVTGPTGSSRKPVMSPGADS